MSLCRRTLVPAARRLGVYRTLQVAAPRLNANVTWPLRNDVSGCKSEDLRSPLGRVCGCYTWGFGSVGAALVGRQQPWDAAALLAGGLRARRFTPEPRRALLHSGPGGSVRLRSLFLSPSVGRRALWEPAAGFMAGTALQEQPAGQLSASKRGQCTNAASNKGPQEPDSGKPNKTQQLKKVFKEYGAVGVAFHISISLVSLGLCYAAISSGIDMTALLFKLGFSETVVQSKMAAGTSTFVLAYAVHKLFAPVRISITLVSVPLLVRYFRKTGLFKPPASSP